MKAAIAVAAAILQYTAVSALGDVGRRGFDCYKAEDNGYSYRGLVDFSSSGRPCQNWLEVGKESPVGDNGIGNHNYCRNPDQSYDSPWCYVHDGAGLSKEECVVDKCEENKRDFEAEAEALERYMEGRGCECPDFFLLGSTTASSLPLFFSTGSCDSGTNHCSMTEVVNKHCHCKVGALHGIVRLSSVVNGNTSTLQAQIPLIHAANASVMPHPHGFLASRVPAAGSSATKFSEDCHAACYSEACNPCQHCIATCQQGPHAFCKTDSKEEMWFAMCGQATEEQLMKGIKQCNDPPPTGCATR